MITPVDSLLIRLKEKLSHYPLPRVKQIEALNLVELILKITQEQKRNPFAELPEISPDDYDQRDLRHDLRNAA